MKDYKNTLIELQLGYHVYIYIYRNDLKILSKSQRWEKHGKPNRIYISSISKDIQFPRFFSFNSMIAVAIQIIVLCSSQIWGFMIPI